MKKLMTFALITLAVWSLESWWLNSRQPDFSTKFALQQFDGTNTNANHLRQFEAGKDLVHLVAGGITLLAAWVCFGSYAKAAFGKITARFVKATPVIVGLLCLVGLTGCMKSYDRPEFVEIDTSETGFLIPLEGDATQQAKFQSEEYLKQRKIATKRVQITPQGPAASGQMLRGVAITTIGMFGGMTYENPEIQKSIDATFIAQQLKVVAQAKFEAQKKENDRIELEANAVAEKARREAMGLADARKTAAAGEAEAIREVNRALNEAQQNPLLYQLKALEVEKSRVEKWDGKYPTYFMGTGGGANLLLQVRRRRARR